MMYIRVFAYTHPSERPQNPSRLLSLKNIDKQSYPLYRVVNVPLRISPIVGSYVVRVEGEDIPEFTTSSLDSLNTWLFNFIEARIKNHG